MILSILLREYLSEREMEVEEIMLTLFDQEHVWNIERNNIRLAALGEGIMQNKTQTVLKMFRHNMPVEDIADISELSVEEVNDILEKAMFIFYFYFE